MILSTVDSSLTQQYRVSIPHDDTKMIKNRRKRRSIRRQRHPEIKKKWLSFELVTLTGNCCWNVWSRTRAGQPFEMTIPETQRPGWTIRAVQLIENCSSNTNSTLSGVEES